MPSRYWFVIVPFLISFAWSTPARPAGPPPTNSIAGAKASPTWRTDFKSAQAEAKRQGLPLLVHFYAEWCGPCKRMEHETLGSLALQKQIQGRFIAVKIDSDQNRDLITRFKIEGLPSDLILSHDGAILARSSAYMDQRSYLARLAEVDARISRTQKTHIAGSSTPVKPTTPAAPGPKPTPSDKTPVAPHGILPDFTADESMPVARPKWALGLRGFSPVALANEKRWTKGSKQYSAEHKGIVYHMASEAELVEFRSAPERFAPQLLGCDPVILEDRDRAVVGDTRFGVYYDNELYFFVTQDNRDRFKSSPHRYTRTKHVLNLKKIQETELR